MSMISKMANFLIPILMKEVSDVQMLHRIICL